MNEQDGNQSSIQQRRSRKTRTVLKQNGKQAPAEQRPANEDTEAWKAYWEAQGHHWRTESEIDADRQQYLAERRNIKPDIEKGIYPFKDVEPKLTRADVEWLLATHENGRGPIDWSDEKQRDRKGLDLRGTNLNDVNLSHMPLARLIGGVTLQERYTTSLDQRNMAAMHLERANLSQIHLEGAYMRNSHLEEAYLELAHLEGADCVAVYFERAYFRNAFLGGTQMRRVNFDTTTYLNEVSLGDKHIGFVSLIDINWGGVNLSTVSWHKMAMLEHERQARQKRTVEGEKKSKEMRLHEYELAIRANRQLSIQLLSQGLNEEAARFAYRTQKLQRAVLYWQKKFGQYIFSLFLDLLAGYGYRPGRSVIWYITVIFGFALAYFAIGHLPFLPDSFVFSLTSFHGRGFFPGLGSENSLHNPLVIMAAFEAVAGLLIEISFIATFTQRFFGK